VIKANPDAPFAFTETKNVFISTKE